MLFLHLYVFDILMIRLHIHSSLMLMIICCSSSTVCSKSIKMKTYYSRKLQLYYKEIFNKYYNEVHCVLQVKSPLFL